MKKMLFIVNPHAGKKVIKQHMVDVCDTFSKAGYTLEVYTTKGQRDATRYVESCGEDFDIIACAGGDGTLEETAEGVMAIERRCGKRIPIGYIPCGSTNDYGKSLRISSDAVKAAKQIVAGDPCPVDIGQLNGKDFIYVAAFGIFTEVSYATPQNLKNMLGHAAYILEGAKSLASVKTYKAEVRFDNRTVRGNFLLCQITNSLSVGGFPAMGTRHMSFSDGIFECVLIRRPKNPADLTRAIKSFLSGKIDKRVIVCEKSSKVEIISKEEIPWVTDGEYAGSFKKAEVKNLKQEIDIILHDKSTYMDTLA